MMFHNGILPESKRTDRVANTRRRTTLPAFPSKITKRNILKRVPWRIVSSGSARQRRTRYRTHRHAMTSSLFDTAPDFDQPVAVLKHCHDRIRKQLKTMDLLASPAVLAATPDEVRQAANAVLRYFQNAAPHPP